MRITDEELTQMYASATLVKVVMPVIVTIRDHEQQTWFDAYGNAWRRAFAAEVANDCARLIAEARTDDPGTALACADMIRERYGVE